MEKHTPGPWNVNHLADDTVRAADGTLVAEVYRNEYEPWNQKLIAAAPELLKALEDILAAFSVSAMLGEGCDPIQNAAAAVRKATGEESLRQCERCQLPIDEYAPGFTLCAACSEENVEE